MLEVLQENESPLPNHEVILDLSMHENAYFFCHHYENVNDDELPHYVDERESECLDVKNFLSQRFQQQEARFQLKIQQS